MKKFKSLLTVGLISLLAGMSTSCEDTKKPVETIDLIQMINLFNESNTYDLTSNVPVQTNSYANGFATSLQARENAIEFNLSDLTTNTIQESYGYANHEDGVMEYSYDEYGDIVPGYLIDASSDDVKMTIQNSEKVDLGLDELRLPSSLKAGTMSYSIDFAFGTDKLLAQQIITGAIPGMTLDGLQSYGSFKENGINLSTDGDGKSIKLVVDYEADDTSAANGESVVFTVENIGTSERLEIEDYLENGGTYKPVSDEAQLLYTLGMTDYVLRLDSVDYNNDGTNDGGIEYVYNVEYGYVGIVYDDTTTPLTWYDKNGDPTGVVEPAQNIFFIPVYGQSNIANNFYITYLDSEGKPDLDVNDPSTFNEDRIYFVQSVADQYFTSSEIMLAFMVSGILSPMPYLFMFPGLSDSADLYLLGDYGVHASDENSYGFSCFDIGLTTEMDELIGYNEEGLNSLYGELVGFTYIFDTDLSTLETMEDIANLGMQLGLYTLDNDDNLNIVTFTYTFTGFGSEKASFSGVNQLIADLYPEDFVE